MLVGIIDGFAIDRMDRDIGMLGAEMVGGANIVGSALCRA